jgi:hypothetical protein
VKSLQASLQKGPNDSFGYTSKKTGSNFINVLLGTKSLCPELPECFEPDDEGLIHCKAMLMFGVERLCPGAFNTTLSHIHVTGMGNHKMYMQDYLHHTVSMFRQPEQRLISGYNDFYHSWGCSERPESVLDYADALQGCSVKMLTRVSGGLLEPFHADKCTKAQADLPKNSKPIGLVCSDHTVPTDKETALAVGRIADLAFVGITEQWDLSMCLFHAMFGGQCHAADFYDGSMPSASGEEPWESTKNPVEKDPVSGLYVTDQLHGFTDEADRKVYAEALRVFYARMQAYNVSRESCQACFQEAESEKLAQMAASG